MVELGGLEPPTSCMPCKRSPSWAIAPLVFFFIFFNWTNNIFNWVIIIIIKEFIIIKIIINFFIYLKLFELINIGVWILWFITKIIICNFRNFIFCTIIKYFDIRFSIISIFNFIFFRNLWTLFIISIKNNFFFFF